VADFRHRFGRNPESLWLPETACDEKTLSLLIDEGIRFVILAPGQAEAYRTTRDGKWQSVADGSIDTSRAFRFSHTDGSGRSIAIFFYNGILARAIAFEQALVSSQVLVRLFKAAAQGSRLVNVATDGETYGHHFKFGDLCLAHTLEIEAPEAGFRITNYADYLDRHGAEFEVEIKKGPDGLGTAWSCAHGVGRWSSDCGCRTGGEAGWNQKWRAPLRAALNYLRDEAAKEFETLGGELFLDPWAARNAYIEVILDAELSRVEFLNRHARRPLSPSEQVRALILLEIQRYSLLMFTSCGWFFSDISGIETIQIMKYAARVMELSEELDLPSARARFLEILAEAKSNRSEMGTGADVFLKYAQRQIVPA
jgi:alpha-amylase/alpha-mannosidase (GH57 family)